MTSYRTIEVGVAGGLWRVLRRLLPVSFALALTLTFETADAWAKANDNAGQAQSTPALSSTTPARAEVERQLGVAVDDDLYEYAQREAKALGLEDFEGGDAVVVIGGTGLAVLVLVLVIVLLL